MRILLFCMLLLSLTNCESSPPSKYIEVCVESHTEIVTEFVPKAAAPLSLMSVGGMAMVTKTKIICDKSKIVKNPRYEEWIKKQKK